ncbi:MAG: sensor histidine kinase, partial [Aggregatilineales bacterium]
LDELLAGVLEVQRPHFEEKGVGLLSDLAAAELPVLADAERLTQVFTNLLVNALNYTGAGGTVCLSLRREGAEAVAEVQDSGVGIDAESLKHVFEPFFRAHLGTQRGTGLGLTIAREIVEAHGGSIAAQSEVDVGTRMIVRLPLAQ